MVRCVKGWVLIFVTNIFSLLYWGEPSGDFCHYKDRCDDICKGPSSHFAKSYLNSHVLHFARTWHRSIQSQCKSIWVDSIEKTLKDPGTRAIIIDAETEEGGLAPAFSWLLATTKVEYQLEYWTWCPWERTSTLEEPNGRANISRFLLLHLLFRESF